MYTMEKILSKKQNKKYDKYESKKEKIKYLENIKMMINSEIEKLKINKDEIIESLKDNFHRECDNSIGISFDDSDTTIDSVIDSMRLHEIIYESYENDCGIDIWIDLNIYKNTYTCVISNNKEDDVYEDTVHWCHEKKQITLSKIKKKDALIIKKINKIIERLLVDHHFLSYIS